MTSSSKGRPHHKHYPPPPKTRFRWNDGEGRYLSAGGILPYDDEGFWVIQEIRGLGRTEWSDIGGKYEVEDCDIWATIAREFGEELYQSSTISRHQVKQWKKVSKIVYINGFKQAPVYLGLCVHLSNMNDITFSPEKFLKNRKKAIQSNGSYSEAYYSSISLRYVKFTELEKEWGSMSYRLKKVLEAIIPEGMKDTYGRLWHPRKAEQSPIKRILQRGSMV